MYSSLARRSRTILVVVGGSIIITNNLHYSMTPSEQLMRIVNDEGIYAISGKKTGACQGQHANHQMMIMNDVVTPTSIDAARCDTLTFMNHQGRTVIVGFGAHPDHTPYAGVSEYSIGAGQNKTITLSETGFFRSTTIYTPRQPAVSPYISNIHRAFVENMLV